LVDPFMTNVNLLLHFQSTRDLFRAPLLAKQALHHAPRFGANFGRGLRSAFQGQLVRLLRTITRPLRLRLNSRLTVDL